MEEPMKHGQCGTPAPLALKSAGGKDKVEFAPAPTMNCRLAASMGEWVDKVLQPAAQQALGSRITRILGSGSYSCRNIYGNPKLSLSEHATGNAIDIAAFVTADGRTITVKKGWGPTERDIVAAKKKAEKKLLAGKPPEKAKADETATVTPTPSIEEAGKKAEVKQKGRVQKTDFKPEADKPAEMVNIDLKPATTKEAVFLKRLHTASCGAICDSARAGGERSASGPLPPRYEGAPVYPRCVPLKSRQRPPNADGPRAPLTTRWPDGVPKAHGTRCRLPCHAHEPAERPDLRSHRGRAGARRLSVFPARATRRAGRRSRCSSLPA